MSRLICLAVCISQERTIQNCSAGKNLLSKIFEKKKAYFTDRSKGVLLLWIFYVFVLSCVCYVFVCVCLYVLCGHLLVKG